MRCRSLAALLLAVALATFLAFHLVDVAVRSAVAPARARR